MFKRKQTIKITCGEGPEAYVITLKGKALTAAQKAFPDPREGEKLAAEIVKAAGERGISKIERTRGKKRVDGVGDEAGYYERHSSYEHHSSGTYFTLHYNQNGQLNDTPNGEVAFYRYQDVTFRWQSPETRRHYKDGKRIRNFEAYQTAERVKNALAPPPQ